VLELKTIRPNGYVLDRVLGEGLEQTAGYADQSGAEEAHLLVCDERPGRTWDEKIYEHSEDFGGREMGVWGL
jgi:hypothetical protein